MRGLSDAVAAKNQCLTTVVRRMEVQVQIGILSCSKQILRLSVAATSASNESFFRPRIAHDEKQILVTRTRD